MTRINPTRLPNERAFPAAHGITAYTPDPDKYHDAGGATLLPHDITSATARTHEGSSRAFDPRAPLVGNVDPDDPYTGQGSTEVVVRGQRMSVEAATALANPVPAPQPGTVIPTSSAVIPTTTATIPAPLSADQQFEQALLGSPPAAGSGFPTNQELGAKLIELLMARATAAPAPAPAQPAIPTQAELELQYVKQQLDELKAAGAAAKAPVLEADADKQDPRRTYEEIGMPWLGYSDAMPPKLQVFFHFPGFLQRTRYWDASVRGQILTIAVDDRYDGDLALPGRFDDPIQIRVPDRDIDVYAINRETHITSGVVTYLNFIIVDKPEEDEEEEHE